MALMETTDSPTEVWDRRTDELRAAGWEHEARARDRYRAAGGQIPPPLPGLLTDSEHPAGWPAADGRIHALPGHVCPECTPHAGPDGRALIPAPGCEQCLEALHLPPPAPDPLDAIRAQLEHIAADLHDQAEQLGGLRRDVAELLGLAKHHKQMLGDNRGELGTVRNVVELRAAGLAEKLDLMAVDQLARLIVTVDRLEAEFGPLARRYSGMIAKAVASPAARFVAGRTRRGEDDNEH